MKTHFGEHVERHRDEQRERCELACAALLDSGLALLALALLLLLLLNRWRIEQVPVSSELGCTTCSFRPPERLPSLPRSPSFSYCHLSLDVNAIDSPEPYAPPSLPALSPTRRNASESPTTTLRSSSLMSTSLSTSAYRTLTFPELLLLVIPSSSAVRRGAAVRDEAQ
jgi:hypothetical protein